MIAHEYHEGQGVSHSEAEHRAAETELRITDGASASACDGRKGTMMRTIHMGHRSHRHRRQRRIAVLRPLEIDVVDRLLKELGGIDRDGNHARAGQARVP